MTISSSSVAIDVTHCIQDGALAERYQLRVLSILHSHNSTDLSLNSMIQQRGQGMNAITLAAFLFVDA